MRAWTSEKRACELCSNFAARRYFVATFRNFVAALAKHSQTGTLNRTRERGNLMNFFFVNYSSKPDWAHFCCAWNFVDYRRWLTVQDFERACQVEHFDEVNPTGETLRRSRTFQMETLTPPSVTLGQTYVIVPRSWWIRQLELCLNGRQLHFSALQYPLGVGQAFNFQDIPRSATLWFTFWCQSGSNRELWLNTCHVIFLIAPVTLGIQINSSTGFVQVYLKDFLLMHLLVSDRRFEMAQRARTGGEPPRQTLLRVPRARLWRSFEGTLLLPTLNFRCHKSSLFCSGLCCCFASSYFYDVALRLHDLCIRTIFSLLVLLDLWMP